MTALTSKFYYANTCSSTKDQDDKSKPKFSCKGVNRKQNSLFWDRALEALTGSMNKAQNAGSKVLGSGIVTYTQSKLGLSYLVLE